MSIRAARNGAIFVVSSPLPGGTETEKGASPIPRSRTVRDRRPLRPRPDVRLDEPCAANRASARVLLRQTDRKPECKQDGFTYSSASFVQNAQSAFANIVWYHNAPEAGFYLQKGKENDIINCVMRLMLSVRSQAPRKTDRARIQKRSDYIEAIFR